MKKKETELTAERRQCLFLAGVLSHYTDAYTAPACRVARAEFDAGRTLARQGWIVLTDPYKAGLFVREQNRETRYEPAH